MVVCVTWFYLIGMISGVLPALQFRQFGGWAASAAAIVILTVGMVTGSIETLVFGLLSLGAWAGIAVGSVLVRRAGGSLPSAP